MATKNQPPEIQLTPKLIVSLSEAQEKIQARIIEGNDLVEKIIQVNQETELDELRREYHKWNDYNRTLLENVIFQNFPLHQEFQKIVIGSSRINFNVEKKQLHDDTEYYINRLESILNKLGLYPSLVSTPSSNVTGVGEAVQTDIFIAHGHDEGAKETVARFVERLGFKPIILHEKPSVGRTIIEKFEEYAKTICFAIVLLTPDDSGSANKTPEVINARARENVIFELGYFNGRLGRSKVCALFKGNVAILSEYSGVLAINIDEKNWQFSLAQEMRAAGLPVDLNKIMSY